MSNCCVFVFFASNRLRRNGFIYVWLPERGVLIRRRPFVWLFGKWQKIFRHKGRIQILIGRKYRPFKSRHGRFFYRVGRKWTRLISRDRKEQKRRSQRRRKARRYRRKLRRIRRYRRRHLRRMRRLRRFRRQTSPLKIHFHGKTRYIYTWRGRWNFRVAGRLRKIR